MGGLFKKKEEVPEEPEIPVYDGDPVADLKQLAIKALIAQSPFTAHITTTCATNEFPITDDQRAALDFEQACLLWTSLIATRYYRSMPESKMNAAITPALEAAVQELQKEFWIQWLQRGATWLAQQRGESGWEAKWSEEDVPFSLPKTTGRSRLFYIQMLMRMHHCLKVLHHENYLAQEKIQSMTAPILERTFCIDELPLEHSDIIQTIIEPQLQKVLDGRIPS